MSGLGRFGFLLAGTVLRWLARGPVGCGAVLLAWARACDSRGAGPPPRP